MALETYKAIALNTSHLHEESLEWLAQYKVHHAFNMCMFRDTGAFLKLYDDLEDNLIKGMPTDLQNVISYCWNHGARLIEFDNAATVVDELPTWEWECDED